MDSVTAILLVFGVAAITGFIVFFLMRFKTSLPIAGPSAEASLLQKQVSDLQQFLATQMNQVMGMVNDRLKENAQLIQQSQATMGERMDNAAKVIGAVQNKLGQVEKATQQIFDVGKDISSLQDMLRAPKFRGSIGEFLLGELLAQMIPPEFFELQYRFKSGEAVDAIIKLKDGLIPIDSKFPLENFKRMVEAGDEAAKKTAQRIFIQDVKKHIDTIAKKYILPEEGTLPFAFMYIPAENVFYETIIKDEKIGEEKSLLQYCMDRKVQPVSPNSFYAYLQTILYGLRGMQIESRAKELWSHLAGLRGEFDRILETFSVMGGHLTNAATKYNEVEKRLERFGGKLEIEPADALHEKKELASFVSSNPEQTA